MTKREQKEFERVEVNSQDYYGNFIHSMGCELYYYVKGIRYKKDIVSKLDSFTNEILQLFLQGELSQYYAIEIIKDCTSILKFICNDRKMGC